jgi:hypothetical protein
MTRRARIAAVWMPTVGMTLRSCGPAAEPPLYPVHGKVMYQGQPAAGATVILRRQDPEPNTTPPGPVGQVDDEGNLSVAVEERGEGAPAGKYAALIQWRARAEGAEEPKPAPAKKGRRAVVPVKPDGAPGRLVGRYMNAEKSPFRVEVKPGEETIDTRVVYLITRAGGEIIGSDQY